MKKTMLGMNPKGWYKFMQGAFDLSLFGILSARVCC